MKVSLYLVSKYPLKLLVIIAHTGFPIFELIQHSKRLRENPHQKIFERYKISRSNYRLIYFFGSAKATI